MSKFTGESALRAAPHDQWLSADPRLFSPRSIDDQGGCTPLVFLCGNRPGLAQPLPGCIRERLDLGRLQHLCSDRQPPSEGIEKYAKRVLPLVCSGGVELLRPTLEGRFVGRELVEPDIMSTNEAQLLQVRIGEPPAAPLVDPDAVSYHAR